MPVLWQITDLSTVDADGNYQDDLAGGMDNPVGFALDTFLPGSTPESVVISSAVASLWRYLQPHEISGRAVARREQIGADITGTLQDDDVTFIIPQASLVKDQEYQLRIVATTSTGQTWVRTREYRCVA